MHKVPSCGWAFEKIVTYRAEFSTGRKARLYETDGATLALGREVEPGGSSGHDLQRNKHDRALIGDPRNDENLIVSQLQVAFLRFHNAVANRVASAQPGLDGPELFALAQTVIDPTRAGATVVCADIDAERVERLNKGEVPILEDGLPELLAEGLASRRLRFVLGAPNAARTAAFVFLCVPTPQGDDGSADLSYIEAAAAEIRRVATLPGMVSVFIRPNPAIDWRPFNDAVYDPIWQAASDTGVPIALHPFFAA